MSQPKSRGHRQSQPPPELVPDEHKRRRRERRMDRTSDLETEIRAWAEQHGFTLRVLNDGHHWLLLTDRHLLFRRGWSVPGWGWPFKAKRGRIVAPGGC